MTAEDDEEKRRDDATDRYFREARNDDSGVVLLPFLERRRGNFDFYSKGLKPINDKFDEILTKLFTQKGTFSIEDYDKYNNIIDDSTKDCKLLIAAIEEAIFGMVFFEKNTYYDKIDKNSFSDKVKELIRETRSYGNKIEVINKTGISIKEGEKHPLWIWGGGKTKNKSTKTCNYPRLQFKDHRNRYTNGAAKQTYRRRKRAIVMMNAM